MSKIQFKALDVLAFTALAAVLEVVFLILFRSMNSAFYVSFAIVFSLILMIRWGWVGIIPAVVAGGATIIYDYAVGIRDSLQWVLANTAGYLPLLLGLLLFKLVGKEKVVNHIGWRFLYVLLAFLLVDVTRTLFFLGNVDFGRILLVFLVYDLINLVIAMALFFLACRQKDFVTDMNSYLIKINQGTPESNFRDDRRSTKDDYATLEEMADSDEVSDIALLDGGMVTQDMLAEQERVRRKMEGQQETKYDKEREAFRKSKSKDEKKGKK